MNPMKLLQIQETFNRFSMAHPKLMPFCKAVADNAIAEGTIMEMKVTAADGKTYMSSIRLTAEDLELFRSARELTK